MAATEDFVARPPITPQLVDGKVVVILRTTSPRHLAAVVEALLSEGQKCVEITYGLPDLVPVFTGLRAGLGDDVSLGVGTVTTLRQAQEAVDAGAAFLVSPGTDPEVIEFGCRHGIPCYPGAFTPTEALTAWHAGAAAVKLFPASTGGLRHLAELRGPLPYIPFIPTGGVGLDDVAAYLQAGAVGVGLGKSLIGDALETGNTQTLRARAQHLARAVREAGRS
jgi:2-dehydro-3-deoxyphosphogluconate aldolase/(4S)-4-hydroxy-2-oxoglutarate aldolase